VERHYQLLLTQKKELEGVVQADHEQNSLRKNPSHQNQEEGVAEVLKVF
jgi:hypothetical protein